MDILVKRANVILINFIFMNERGIIDDGVKSNEGEMYKYIDKINMC